jgi:hypothetical protein
MARELGYVPIGRIFSKISRDLGLDEFSEADVVEWAAEALEAIDAVTMLEECVYFSEVVNHQAQMPPYSKAIIQIAKYNNRDQDLGHYTAGQEEYFKTLYPAQIAAEMCASDPTCANAPVSDCPACDTAKYIPVDPVTGFPIFDSDLYVWKPYINVQIEYINWANSDWLTRAWAPVRLATHSFFNTVVCGEKANPTVNIPQINPDGTPILLDGENDLYSSTMDEYTIVGDRTLRFSFKTGYVAIAYLRPVLGEDNYPMIPDHFSYVTAVFQYVTMKLMGRMWYLGREGYADKFQKAEADWNWYCKQAGNRGMMPHGIDQFQNMLDTSQYLLPRIFRYNQFFMDMARPEGRKYNDPDFRNNNNRRLGLGYSNT